jgi:hypothetical protein
MRLVECSYEYCSDDGHHPRCKEYQRQNYRIRYNEKRALTIIIILFITMILVMLGGVYLAGVMAGA